MKNKEKYAKEIVEIACNRGLIAIEKRTGKLRPCIELPCSDCMFGKIWNCAEATRKWAESEYIEPVKISKRDRALLEYIKDKYKYIARDLDGDLYVYTEKPPKMIDCYDGMLCESRTLNKICDIKFPMVRWEDSEPWLIEDLKKLEVCEEYEID